MQSLNIENVQDVEASVSNNKNKEVKCNIKDRLYTSKIFFMLKNGTCLHIHSQITWITEQANDIFVIK